MDTSRNYVYQYRQMFTKNRAVMLVIDPVDGGIIDASLGACEYYGYSLPEITAMSTFDINTLSKAETAAEMQRVKEMHTNHFNFKHRLASGEVRDVDVISNPINLDDKTYLYSIIQDVTSFKRAEEALRESEEKFRGIFVESVAAIYVFDENKSFIDSNQAGLDLLGYSREELLRLTISDVDKNPDAVIPAHNQLLGGGRISNYEHELIRKDGKTITVLNNSRPLTGKDGAVIGMQSTLINISERKQTENKLIKSKKKTERALESLSELNLQLQTEIAHRDQALKRLNHVSLNDYLTESPNLAGIKIKANEVLADGEKAHNRVAIMVINLGEIEHINLNYGVEIGNAVLVEISLLIKDTVRDSDIVGRSVGAEFITLFPNCQSVNLVEEIAQQIIDKVNQPLETMTSETISACIGISIYPEHSESADELMLLAYNAMHDAKKSGKNRFITSRKQENYGL